MKKLKLNTPEGQSTALTKSSHEEPQKSKKKKKKKKKKEKLKIQELKVSTTTPDLKEEVHIPAADNKLEEKHTTSADSKLQEIKAVQSELRSNLSTLWVDFKPRSTTLIRAGTNWFEQLIVEDSSKKVPVDPYTKKDLKQVAEKILQQDVENYKKIEKSKQRGDTKFRQTIYNVGTFRDKLAAHVLRCMEAPAHSLHNLNLIIMMISPKAKNEFQEAIDSIKQLLDSSLLPDSRVARKFEDHDFACLVPFLAESRELAEKYLALWYFEDQLAFAYRKLIGQLKQVAGDTVDQTKMVAIKSMINVLKTHPMQETEIVLDSVINKLGDPSRKVASQAMQSLQHLLLNCFQLKASVVALVEILMYRPNVSEKTQYYCLCFMKDVLFKKNDFQLAAKMIKIYIGFFKACTKKGEVDTRMMGALLRGINRAFPFSRLRGEALQEQLQTLYKLCHIVNFSIATQALQLIYHILKSQNHIEDRFYQALYGKIQDPEFSTSTGNAAFLNLVFKAMLRDESVERRQAFIKRMLQVGQYQSPQLVCGILYLISEVRKEKDDMKFAIESVLQSKVVTEEPDDDFETFEDVDDDDDESQDKTNSKDTNLINATDKENDVKEDLKPLVDPPPSASSWFHSANTTKVATHFRRSQYDPYHRNPQYCGAQFTPLWELLLLQTHFHPSVAVFAKNILDASAIDYSGDPMEDFTLIRFLDRFVYKNPKKIVEEKEIGAHASILGSRAKYCPPGARGIAVNTEEFLTMEYSDVPEDQQFFHAYFNKFKTSKTKRKREDDEESIEDDEFDEYLGIGSFDKSEEEDLDNDLDFAAGTRSVDVKGDDDGSDGDSDLDDEEEDDEHGDEDEDDDAEIIGGEEGDEEFDEENIVFSDEDEDDFGGSKPSKKQGATKKLPKKKKRSQHDSLDSMFASADDFTHLLEDNADADPGMMSSTSKALANKDKAHVKQLHWEVDRNEKIKDHGRYGGRGNAKSMRGQKRNFRGTAAKKPFKGTFSGPKKNIGSSRGKNNRSSMRGRRK